MSEKKPYSFDLKVIIMAIFSLKRGKEVQIASKITLRSPVVPSIGLTFSMPTAIFQYDKGLVNNYGEGGEEATI